MPSTHTGGPNEYSRGLYLSIRAACFLPQVGNLLHTLLNSHPSLKLFSNRMSIFGEGVLTREKVTPKLLLDTEIEVIDINMHHSSSHH